MIGDDHESWALSEIPLSVIVHQSVQFKTLQTRNTERYFTHQHLVMTEREANVLWKNTLRLEPWTDSGHGELITGPQFGANSSSARRNEAPERLFFFLLHINEI